MHLSLDFVALCEKHCIRPYFLRAYLTRALCALDQEPHSCMARLWSQFKARWKNNISIYVAVKALREICLASLKDSKAAAGWKRCGFEVGKPLNRDKLLVERRSEIMCSQRSAVTKPPQDPVLLALKQCSPSKTRCTGCGAWTPSTAKFCPNCAAPNKDFKNEDYEVHREGKRAGWRPNEHAEVPQLDAETSQAVTDLMAELRRRKKPQEDKPTAGHPAASASKGKPEEKEENMEDAEDEWNLNSIDDSVSYLESHFPMEEALSLHCNADMFTREARWYVEALQKRTPRAPLAHHFC